MRRRPAVAHREWGLHPASCRPALAGSQDRRKSLRLGSQNQRSAKLAWRSRQWSPGGRAAHARRSISRRDAAAFRRNSRIPPVHSAAHRRPDHLASPARPYWRGSRRGAGREAMAACTRATGAAALGRLAWHPLGRFQFRAGDLPRILHDDHGPGRCGTGRGRRGGPARRVATRGPRLLADGPDHDGELAGVPPGPVPRDLEVARAPAGRGDAGGRRRPDRGAAARDLARVDPLGRVGHGYRAGRGLDRPGVLVAGGRARARQWRDARR